MMYGLKCSKCGLMQLPQATCKACGAVLEAPPEAPRRASARAPLRDVPKPSPQPFSTAASQVSPKAPLEMNLDIPFEDAGQAPWGAPIEGRTPRSAKNCDECGMEFSDEELIRIGDVRVCAGCKPLIVQKLREGVILAGEMVYAGFWIRFGAKIIDAIILTVLGFVVSIPGYFITGAPQSGGQISMGFIAGNGLIALISVAVQIAYPVYLLGKYSATLGKMACGLKVVRSDGDKISYARAFGRYFAEILSSIILGIGYIIAAFDEEKRALHDRICDTRVIKG